MTLSQNELFEFLELKHEQFNNRDFITTDPISVPHQFRLKEDIEISGFLAATIAWGQRKTILSNANKLMEWMDFSPFQFIVGFREHDLIPFEKFVHRTFNGDDCVCFLKSLQNIYLCHGGLQKAFQPESSDSEKAKSAIMNFRKMFFEKYSLERTFKHVANPDKGSSAKRLNMFLRWMVRNDQRGVDFGIWNQLSSADLVCPLDVHTANVSRKLNLLSRTQNDWKAALELTNRLRTFDPNDPVKYDFALFGLGVFDKFNSL